MSDSVHNPANDDNGKGMNDSERLHLPNAEFIATLESDIVDAFRRQSTLVPPLIAVKRRRFQNAGLVGLGLMLGIVAGIAPAQVQNAQQRNELSLSQDMAKTMAQLRMKFAQTKYESLKKSVDAGATSSDALAQALLDVKFAESEVARVNLNAAEVQLSAAAPNDALWAPLVGNRDFVTERLNLDADLAQQRVSQLEQVAGEEARRVRVGMATEIVLLEAQHDVSDATRALNLSVRKLALRKMFLDKKIDQKAITQNLAIDQLRDEVMRLTERVDVSERRANFLHKREAAGVASELEVKKAEVDVLEGKMQLEQLQHLFQSVLTAGKYRKN